LGKVRFNDKKFRSCVTEWVNGISDSDLTRAWDIVQGCLQVHAKVDKEASQTLGESRMEVYEDFSLAIEGEAATYAMIGLLHEFEQMTPDEFREKGEFEMKMSEATAKAKGVAPQPYTPERTYPAPHLEVLEGGKT
jgi:hypothetical protein